MTIIKIKNPVVRGLACFAGVLLLLAAVGVVFYVVGLGARNTILTSGISAEGLLGTIICGAGVIGAVGMVLSVVFIIIAFISVGLSSKGGVGMP